MSVEIEEQLPPPLPKGKNRKIHTLQNFTRLSYVD